MPARRRRAKANYTGLCDEVRLCAFEIIIAKNELNVVQIIYIFPQFISPKVACGAVIVYSDYRLGRILDKHVLHRLDFSSNEKNRKIILEVPRITLKRFYCPAKNAACVYYWMQ